MSEILAEFAHETSIPFPVLALRIALALALGALIGLEREWRHHPAGLRTHVMVCLAACIYGILTLEIALLRFAEGISVQVDPIRAVEAVTAGVAFLAAGLIWSGQGRVHGLTTGAGLWLAGAIGLACGLGLWQIALTGTALALLVLGLMSVLTGKGSPPADPPSDRGDPIS